MSPLAIGGLGPGALLALILAQVPIGFAMIIVGVAGVALQTNWTAALPTIYRGVTPFIIADLVLLTLLGCSRQSVCGCWPGLRAVSPSTLTRPAITSAWAWDRLSTRPRATRARSSRCGAGAVGVMPERSPPSISPSSVSSVPPWFIPR